MGCVHHTHRNGAYINENNTKSKNSTCELIDDDELAEGQDTKEKAWGCPSNPRQPNKCKKTKGFKLNFSRSGKQKWYGKRILRLNEDATKITSMMGKPALTLKILKCIQLSKI
jgi:hypothetical protein